MLQHIPYTGHPLLRMNANLSAHFPGSLTTVDSFEKLPVLTRKNCVSAGNRLLGKDPTSMPVARGTSTQYIVCWASPTEECIPLNAHAVFWSVPMKTGAMSQGIRCSYIMLCDWHPLLRESPTSQYQMFLVSPTPRQIPAFSPLQ